MQGSRTLRGPELIGDRLVVGLELAVLLLDHLEVRPLRLPLRHPRLARARVPRARQLLREAFDLPAPARVRRQLGAARPNPLRIDRCARALGPLRGAAQAEAGRTSSAMESYFACIAFRLSERPRSMIRYTIRSSVAASTDATIDRSRARDAVISASTSRSFICV